MKRQFAIVLLVLLLLPAILARAQAPTHFLVTLELPDPRLRSAVLQQGFPLWGATLHDLTLVVDGEQLRSLQKLGYTVSSLQPLDFPLHFEDYHNYSEMVAEIDAVAAQYPDIVRLVSLGKTIEQRDVWALRITDHPDADEPDEKAILIFANTHAREHLTVEQALFLIHDLVQNYGHDGEITNLVNQRDIWIIPSLNPDGAEYDIGGSSFRWWRKNRRDNGNGTFGVDLNRNFGYQWGCCGGSSGFPGNSLYRGPAPFSEPETQTIRDFARAHPHLTTSISLHTWGELLLYPYGYTYTDIPVDMDATDYQIFRALGSGVSDRNGYRLQQASDLYITDGDSDDWLYGELGIYAFTWELYPRSSNPGFYPNDSVIPVQTERNRSALRYAIAMADDPAKSIDAGQDMQPPGIQITSPLTTSTLFEGAPITVTVDITDNVGVTTVAYWLDDQPLAVADQPPFSIVFTATLGMHRLGARAYDAAHWQADATALALDVLTDPNASPTPTPTLSPSPTLTPTLTPSPTPTPTPVYVCAEGVRNGDFEADSDWIMPGTPATARYSSEQAHQGLRSARLGLLPGASLDDSLQPATTLWGEKVPAGAAYSTAYQTLSIPAQLHSATLSFWLYSGSEATGNDWQRVMLLKPGSFSKIREFMRVLENDQVWKQYQFDLTPYRGRDVVLTFEVYNNSTAATGRTWMYGDDVSLQVCNAPSPTPTLTPSPTPTPTPVYVCAEGVR
ncbi:MAG: zinc carboxypeptidase, partial [Chloroflexi bacterium]|nr:zinc carboxypeptidase [Chloroflexota bacterium]